MLSIDKLITTIIALALVFCLYKYVSEQDKINTYYFVSENTDVDTTICKVDNENDCLSDEEYSISKTINSNIYNTYIGLDKQDNQFTIITNQEYHTEAWSNYKINAKNKSNNNLLLVIIVILSIALIIYIAQLSYSRYSIKEHYIDKYGTEE